MGTLFNFKKHSVLSTIRQMVLEANRYANEGDFNNALRLLHRALRREPHHVGVLHLIAKTYQEKGDTDSELKFLRAALVIEP